MYHWQIEEVADIKKSNQWLEKIGLALIMALFTRTIEAGVYHTR